MVVFVPNSHSSSLSNPCPSGTDIGYGEFNGTIFVICDATFNHNNNSVDALGLGLGLGLGIPMIVVLIWAVVFMNRWWCYRNKYEVRRPVTAEEIKYGYRIDNEGTSTPKEYVKLKLGPELFEQFIKGNLTIELKKKLCALRDEQGSPRFDYALVARNLNNIILAEWIENISYRPIQDEGIV